MRQSCFRPCYCGGGVRSAANALSSSCLLAAFASASGLPSESSFCICMCRFSLHKRRFGTFKGIFVIGRVYRKQYISSRYFSALRIVPFLQIAVYSGVDLRSIKSLSLSVASKEAGRFELFISSTAARHRTRGGGSIPRLLVSRNRIKVRRLKKPQQIYKIFPSEVS